MTRGEWYACVLIGAGEDYRFARAIFELGHHQLAVVIGLKAAGVTNFPTASQRNGRQGKS